MSLSILQKPDQLGSPPARLVIGCGAGVTLGTPPDGRGEAVKPLGRLQLQIYSGGVVLICALAVAAVTC